MSEELQVIRGFLESVGYETDNGADTSELWSISIGEYPSNWTCFSPWMRKISQAENCKLALNHYLSTQLGVHWRYVWENWLAVDSWTQASPVLPYSDIQKAIDYLEQLEKGETA